MGSDDLRERVAEVLQDDSGRALEMFYPLADAVLDALGLEQVGWWVAPWDGEGERLSFHDPGFQHERHPVYRLAAGAA